MQSMSYCEIYSYIKNKQLFLLVAQISFHYFSSTIALQKPLFLVVRGHLSDEFFSLSMAG